MAEKKDTELTCTVCLEPFTDPKVLPCCHTFCKKCLEGTLEKAKKKKKKLDRSILCPQCRAEHKVPSNGVDGFLNDYTVPEVHNKPASSAKPICELCDSQGTAVAHCDECSAYLCDSCTSAHKTIKTFKSHKVEALSSDKPLVSVKKPNAIHCSQHPEELIKLYCKTCQSVACVLCVVASHNNHNFGNIDSETRKEMEGQIRDLVVKAEAKLGEFEENLKFISEVEEDKTKEPVQLKDEINKSFDSLITTIEARRAALLEEVEAASNKDLKELWAQRDVVETTIAGLKGILSFANRSLLCSNDLELLLLSTQVKSRLKQFSEKKWDATSTETISMTSRKYSIKRPPELSGLGQVNIFTVKDSPVITKPTSALLGKQVTFKVQAVRMAKQKKRELPKLEVKILHGKRRVEIPYPPTVTPDPEKRILSFSEFLLSPTVNPDPEKKTLSLSEFLRPPTVTPDPEKRTWSVRFTPVVSGYHVVQAKINLGDISKETELTISVTGKPAVGARVQRGPDWEDLDPYDDDNGEGSIAHQAEYSPYSVRVHWDAMSQASRNDYGRWGRRTAFSYTQDDRWDAGGYRSRNVYEYRWGNGGNYDIQLAT